MASSVTKSVLVKSVRRCELWTSQKTFSKFKNGSMGGCWMNGWSDWQTEGRQLPIAHKYNLLLLYFFLYGIVLSNLVVYLVAFADTTWKLSKQNFVISGGHYIWLNSIMYRRFNSKYRSKTELSLSQKPLKLFKHLPSLSDSGTGNSAAKMEG